MVTLDRASFGISATKEPEQAFVLRTVTGRASVQESVFPVKPGMRKMHNRVVRAAVFYDAEAPVDEFAHGGADGVAMFGLPFAASRLSRVL